MGDPGHSGVCHKCGIEHGTKLPPRKHSRRSGLCSWCGKYFDDKHGGITAPRQYGLEENDGGEYQA